MEVSFNPEDPKPVQVLNDCHADWITDCKWSNIGDFLVTSSNDFNLKVWDLKTGTEKFKMTGHMAAINHVAYNTGCVMSTCTDGSVKVWSHKGEEITTLYGHSQRVNGCDMSVKLTGQVEDGELEYWNIYVQKLSYIAYIKRKENRNQYKNDECIK